MVLAAGFGKRMHPLTLKHPKPLLKIGSETLLSNTLKFLETLKVTKVVINVHYLREQIIDYVNKSKFNFSIDIVTEQDKILNTGGGVFNAIHHFSNEPFLVINPDTIWNLNYSKEIKLMEKYFYENIKNKCSLLVVDKKKSFDKSFKGDFNLKDNLINREDKNNLRYIYTGFQFIRPEAFLDSNDSVFSINRIWDKLISKNELFGMESNIDFLHVSTLDVYNDLLKKNLKN